MKTRRGGKERKKEIYMFIWNPKLSFLVFLFSLFPFFRFSFFTFFSFSLFFSSFLYSVVLSFQFYSFSFKLFLVLSFHLCTIIWQRGGGLVGQNDTWLGGEIINGLTKPHFHYLHLHIYIYKYIYLHIIYVEYAYAFLEETPTLYYSCDGLRVECSDVKGNLKRS